MNNLSLGDISAVAAKASQLQANLGNTNYALAQLQNNFTQTQASLAAQVTAGVAAAQAAAASIYVPSLQVCTIETIASGTGSASSTEVTLSSISGFTVPSTLVAVWLQIDLGVSVGSGSSFELSPSGSLGTWFNALSIPSLPTGSSGLVSGTCLLPCTTAFYYQSTGSSNTWTLRLIGYIG